VSVEDSTVGRAVTLRTNIESTLVSANQIGGALTCTGNQPPPVDNGLPNTVSGPRSGQCAKL
jgi:hexosaminidase